MNKRKTEIKNDYPTFHSDPLYWTKYCQSPRFGQQYTRYFYKQLKILIRSAITGCLVKI